MLPKKSLGKTGLQVTQLGYGSMGLRGPRTWGVRVVDDETAERVLHSVLDAGINFIDTAPDYGVAEERIGRFLAHRRDEFFLATKCGCTPIPHDDHLEIRHAYEVDVIKRNLETSLNRLQTDVIDLMQFHGGDAETLQRNGVIDLLEDFRAQGIIRCLGVSSSLPQLPALIDLGVFETYQVPYSCLAPQHAECLQRIQQQEAGVILRGGIAHGGPDAVIQRPQLNSVWDAAQLDELLPTNMTRAELILRATLSHPACDTVIVGTCDLQHLEDNLSTARRGPLPFDLIREIRDRVTSVLRSAGESRQR